MPCAPCSCQRTSQRVGDLDFLTDILGEIVGSLILYILCCVLLLPALLILSTPVVFVVAAFGDGGYVERVGLAYDGVFAFWRQYCLL
ncbi:MAG: hypothetical protein A3K19_20795 [Lentisphaerae bacterium RIFOXYB12_FULL_65_16]|nr:MAG: hypothetical protein A3K18_19220 [Lentisphaerae bacterium RIFOXYA12_64_32]OGV85225.1 MAG: hypothetical protein A3K19_20795 [Lentisphaerae bacterium RIFOXYB12_FULL_65_16]